MRKIVTAFVIFIFTGTSFVLLSTLFGVMPAMKDRLFVAVFTGLALSIQYVFQSRKRR
ncbi:MAG: hypothetical protein LBS79_10585 [Tannerella sp.]|jgi:hypothetical protein|nr:hypothetical protein [Tannerella sp.]